MVRRHGRLVANGLPELDLCELHGNSAMRRPATIPDLWRSYGLHRRAYGLAPRRIRLKGMASAVPFLLCASRAVVRAAVIRSGAAGVRHLGEIGHCPQKLDSAISQLGYGFIQIV